MLRPRTLCALCFVASAAPTLSDKTAGGATNASEAEWRSMGKVATFGGEGLSGSLTLQFNTERHKVQWTTSDITVPVTLIQEKCGDSTGEHGFSYSINEAWRHFTSHAQGADCGELWTGGHWDPTAVCSRGSLNGACLYCLTELYGYECSPETFDSDKDHKGSFAYRWLNRKACELGDLSGMKGELKAVLPEDNETESITIPPLLLPGGLAQMSAPFASLSFDSVYGHGLGINCDSSGPPAAHGTNCECVGYNGKRSPSIGTVTVLHPRAHNNPPFYHAGGWKLPELQGKSIVVRCGSSFGAKAGTPLFCAKLK